MFERERKLYAFTLGYCEGLMADIEQEQMETQPTASVNPPAWLLGHLAICTDFALDLMGQPKQLPPEWSREFGPGSTPLPQEHPYPDKDELLSALRTGHQLVSDASRHVTDEQLAVPNPLEMAVLKRALPTVGDLLAHLMTTHEAGHLGHLSNWRRQMGMAPLF